MTAVTRIRTLLAAHPWRALGGAVAVVAVVAVAAVVVLTRDGDDEDRAQVATTTTRQPPVAPLTGMTGDFEGRLDRPALFVKIDNVEEARPHAGLDQADIVIEEQVEGDLTRLAAVFHSGDAAELGPVRSVRTTDIELVSLLGRVLFASSGGNANVLPQVQAADVVDIGHNVSGEGFVRQDGRDAPHNLFTSTPELYAKAPESPPPPRPVFSYLAEGGALPATAVPTGGVALRFGADEVARFTWDEGSGTWPRAQRGTSHVLTTGDQLAPVNVVVLEIAYDFSGEEGRSVPHGVVTGEGRAAVLTQGHVIEGTWSRPTLADALRLVAADGEEIALTPGQTFLELPPPGGWDLL
jgi:hypothetical protein